MKKKELHTRKQKNSVTECHSNMKNLVKKQY